MIITPQLVFTILGVVGMVAAVTLLAIALVYYVKNDIRGVKDDLAGRARQRGRGGSPRARTRRTRTVTKAAPAQGALANSGIESVAFDNVAQPMEDDLDTVLDTKLRNVSHQDIVSSDAMDVNDDIPTLVTSAGDYYQSGMPEQNMKEADMPTAINSGEEDQPTQVEMAPMDNASVFVVTRSILAIHSDEIIAAG